MERMKKVIVKLARDLGPKVCEKMNYTASFYQADDADIAHDSEISSKKR